MAEISTLNGYKIKDKKAIRYYNTVADMVADTTLKDGMHAQTKGYHAINDGGASEYHITNSESLTDYQESLNNNLYATLIIKDVLNVKQMGAYGDGVHDDTRILQSAINTNKRLILDGTFKITDTLTVDVGYNKGIEGNGISKILADFTGGEFDTIKLINTLYTGLSGLYGTAKEFVLKNLILTEINEENITDTTHYGSGICLGNGCNNVKIDNLKISNFKYAIYGLNSAHGVYLIKFENIHTDHNDYGIYLNLNSSNDCGENFSFNQCIIGTSKLGNMINNDMYVNFTNCSFDYNLGNTFKIKDSANVSLSNCHIEWYHSTPLIDIEYNASIKFFGCTFLKNDYDDGGTPTYFINASVGDAIPEILFNGCCFFMKATYTNLINSSAAYVKFENCNRQEYNPTTFMSIYDKINFEEANKYLYPLNYDSGLTRNQSKVKVTCATVKSGNKIILPYDYHNKEAKITIKVNSSIDLNLPIVVGTGKFLGEAIVERAGEITYNNNIVSNTDTTINIYHKFRKGLTYTPYVQFNLGELTQGATFEVKEISLQLI